MGTVIVFDEYVLFTYLLTYLLTYARRRGHCHCLRRVRAVVLTNLCMCMHHGCMCMHMSSRQLTPCTRGAGDALQLARGHTCIHTHLMCIHTYIGTWCPTSYGMHTYMHTYTLDVHTYMHAYIHRYVMTSNWREDEFKAFQEVGLSYVILSCLVLSYRIIYDRIVSYHI